MPRSLFRIQPTQEIVEKALRALGIDGLDSIQEVCFTHLNTDLAAEVLEEMRQFYYPCIAKRYLKTDFDYKDYMTVVRQLLKTRQRIFRRREKCVKIGDKTYQYIPYYSLQPGVRQDFSIALN